MQHQKKNICMRDEYQGTSAHTSVSLARGQQGEQAVPTR